MKYFVASILLLIPSVVIHAADQDLAKKLANPVASLISVPFDYDQDSSIGTADGGSRTTLILKPVVPISLNENWNVISRTIIPLVNQTEISPGSGTQSGLGDINASFFFSPKVPTKSGLIWGVGPAFSLPTASDVLLGSEKWGLGPTGLVLKQKGKVTYGMLASHIWSVAGNAARNDVSSTLLQPFISRTSKTATTIALQTESIYNWQTKEWSVPINASIAQILKFGDQLVQLKAGVRYWAQSPATGAKGWGYKIGAVLLFPKK